MGIEVVGQRSEEQHAQRPRFQRRQGGAVAGQLAQQRQAGGSTQKAPLWVVQGFPGQGVGVHIVAGNDDGQGVGSGGGGRSVKGGGAVEGVPKLPADDLKLLIVDILAEGVGAGQHLAVAVNAGVGAAQVGGRVDDEGGNGHGVSLWLVVGGWWLVQATNHQPPATISVYAAGEPSSPTGRVGMGTSGNW